MLLLPAMASKAVRLAVAAGWKRLPESLLPATQTALADAFARACSLADSALLTGFGDSLSSEAFASDIIGEFVAVLVQGELAGHRQSLARELRMTLPPDVDNYSGTDTARYFERLIEEVEAQCRSAAQRGEPLRSWYVLVQGSATLDGVQALASAAANVEATLVALVSAQTPPAIGPSASRPFHNVERRPDWPFVGRAEEIRKIRVALAPTDRSLGARIEGVGGVGKSTLALEVAHRLIDEYHDSAQADRFDAIVWSSAKRDSMTLSGRRDRPQSLRTLDDLIRDIVWTIGRPDILGLSTEDQRRAVHMVLQEPALRTLLIVDNLETVDDSSITEWLSNVPLPTKVILTSRHAVDFARRIALESMSLDESISFVHGVVGEAAISLAEVAELHRRCGGIPLALELAAQRIAKGSSIDTEIDRLASAGDVVEFSISASVARIDGLGPGRILDALCTFEGDVSRELLASSSGHRDLPALFTDGLIELTDLSLAVTRAGNVDVHPLTRSFVRRAIELTDERRIVVASTLEAAIVQFAAPFRAPEWQWRDLVALRRDGRHFEALLANAEAEGNIGLAIQLAPAVIEYYDITGEWVSLLELSDRAMSYADIVDEPAAGLHAAWLAAGICAQQGDFARSASTLERAERWVHTLGDRHAQFQSWAQHFRLAGDHSTSARWNALAEELVATSTDPEADLWRANVAFEAGKLLRDQMEWAAAAEKFRLAAAVLTEDQARALINGESSGLRFNVERTWGLLGNLGLVDLRLGEPRRALPTLSRATEYFRQHGRIGNLVSNLLRLAEAYILLDEAAAAEDLLDEATAWAARLNLVRDLEHAAALRPPATAVAKNRLHH